MFKNLMLAALFTLVAILIAVFGFHEKHSFMEIMIYLTVITSLYDIGDLKKDLKNAVYGPDR